MKIKDLKIPLKGSCHCGVIKFKINTSLRDLRRCNCSICSRKGFVMGSAPMELLKIVSGKKFLSTYKWNTNIAEHYFCKICGINTHHKRRSNPNEYGFNIACIEGFEMSWIENAPYVDNTKMSLVDINKSKICLLYTSPSPRDS